MTETAYVEYAEGKRLEALEAALTAAEKEAGLSRHAIIRRRLEAVFTALGLETGVLQAERFEGRVTAQWGNRGGTE